MRRVDSRECQNPVVWIENRCRERHLRQRSGIWISHLQYNNSFSIYPCPRIEKMLTKYRFASRTRIQIWSRIRDSRSASDLELDLLTGQSAYDVNSNLCWIEWHINGVAELSGLAPVLASCLQNRHRSVHRRDLK
jgi:hypothetical protein